MTLRFDNIYAQYGQFIVLNGATMDVPAGDLRVVIGLNGAGKSTMAKCLFGLLKVTRGKIHFGGRDITNAPSRQLLELGIAYVPQRPSIFPQLTVTDNLEMGLFLSKGEVHAILRNPMPDTGRRHQTGNKMALDNIRERLALHFDAEASLESKVTKEGYEVHIRMPYRTTRPESTVDARDAQPRSTSGRAGCAAR